jgi:hypothetical protein
MQHHYEVITSLGTTHLKCEEPRGCSAVSKVSVRAFSGMSHSKAVVIWNRRTVCVYRLKIQGEERRKQTWDIYERESCALCLAISPTYSQLVSGLYIYATVISPIK